MAHVRRIGICAAAWGGALLLAAAWAGVRAGSTYDPTAELARIRAEIAAHGYGWEAGETELMRLPPEARRQWLGGRAPAPGASPVAEGYAGARDLPAVWDWRVQGGVTPAKNQGACSSCWAFASVGALEAAVRIADGRIVDLSEQQVISCNQTDGDCTDGGLPDGFDFLTRWPAVAETCMPYQMDDEVPCQYDCYYVAYADSYALVPGDMLSMKQSVYQQPLAAGVHVYDDFYAYTGGCYEHAGNDPVNHYLLIVGWDDTACDGAGAWICKNSWGRHWGIDGYCILRYGCCQLGVGAYAVQYGGTEPIFIHHTPLEDTEEHGAPYPVVCDLATRDAPLDPDALWLYYRRATQADWSREPLTPVESEPPGRHVACIPPPNLPTTLYYYIAAADMLGNQRRVPPGAPDSAFAFQVTFSPICFHEDGEGGGNGWSLSAPGDDATAGFWELGVPQETHDGYQYPCNPPEDHTPGGGRQCFCTGLLQGITYMDYDVDGGRTTLTSPRIELSLATGARVEYYRWFSNGAHPHPDDDYWQVDVSDDDGLSWVSLEYTNDDDPSWQLRGFDLTGCIAMTDSVRLRFIASDYAPLSIVEAAVDDVVVRATGWVAQSVAAAEARAPRFDLTVDPVPATSTVRLRLASDAGWRGSLRVFGPDGRPVRHLGLERIGAGLQTLVWDGRDDAGRPVASGIYFLRLPDESTPPVRVILLR